MTTLAANAVRAYEIGDINSLPVIATDIIYEGAAVGDNASGYARPLVAGDPFRGFALRKADNSAGAAGAVRVEVRSSGLVQLSIGSLAITDVGKDVYASDDDTFTLTQSTNTRIGHVYRWVSTGVGIVAFSAQSSDIAELVDNTGGSADGTLADGLTATAPAALTAVDLDNEIVASADAQQDVVALTVTDGTMGGTADGAFETIGSTSGGDVSAAIMNNFKEVQAKLALAQANDATIAVQVDALVADITALRAVVAALVTDATTQNTNDADLAAKLNEVVRRLGG